MWLLILAIVLLSFSAFFAAHLAVFYPPPARIRFARGTSKVLGLVGVIMLFVSTGWKWGLVGIAAYLILNFLSKVFWHKRYESDIKAGRNPYRTSND